jgi:hypothetical protein
MQNMSLNFSKILCKYLSTKGRVLNKPEKMISGIDKVVNHQEYH